MDEKKELALKHSELLYDYIKFHLGLYIATPPVVAILAEALDVTKSRSFQIGMIGMVLAYLTAGISASWMIAGRINKDWTTDELWASLGLKASSGWRRLIQHYLYWLGLAFGLCGMFWNSVCTHFSALRCSPF